MMTRVQLFVFVIAGALGIWFWKAVVGIFIK